MKIRNILVSKEKYTPTDTINRVVDTYSGEYNSHDPFALDIDTRRGEFRYRPCGQGGYSSWYPLEESIKSIPSKVGQAEVEWDSKKYPVKGE